MIIGVVDKSKLIGDGISGGWWMGWGKPPLEWYGKHTNIEKERTKQANPKPNKRATPKFVCWFTLTVSGHLFDPGWTTQ